MNVNVNVKHTIAFSGNVSCAAKKMLLPMNITEDLNYMIHASNLFHYTKTSEILPLVLLPVYSGRGTNSPIKVYV